MPLSLRPRALLPLVIAVAVSAMPAARADDVQEAQRLAASGQPAEALALLDRVLQSSPQDARTRLQRALLLADAGRTTEAEQAYGALSADFPELAEPYNNLAVLQAARGDYDAARLSLESALRARPGYATAWHNLADVHLALARVAYARAAALDPANPVIAPRLRLLRELDVPKTR